MMKPFLVSIAVAGSVCCLSSTTHAATLMYGFDFDQVAGSQLALNNLGDGTAAVTNNTSTSSTYSQSPVGDSSGKSVNIAGTKGFSIQDASGIGLNTSTGVTIGMHINFASSNSSWTDVLTIGMGGESIRLERTGKGGGFALYDKEGSPTGLHNASPQPVLDGSYPGSGSWFHLAITIQDNNWSFYISKLNGGVWTTSLVGTATASESFTGNLDWLKLGGTNVNGATYVDNFAAYNGVLSADDINYLAGNPIEKELPLIPEPATATLSLLGLTALLARRRRG